MSTANNKNYNTPGGGIGSAGTNDVRVDRPNEGLSGQATTDDTTAANPTRNNFDTFKAIGTLSRQNATIDTSGTSYQDMSTDVKRGRSSVW